VTWYANGNYGTPLVVGPTILMSSLPLGTTTLNCVATFGFCADTTELLAVTNYDCNVTPLVHQVIQLSGEALLTDHLLRWTSSYPFIQFEIERSIDGKTFNTIASINEYDYSSKNSTQTYFYRVKGKMHDGIAVYSNIVKLGDQKDEILIYPNPATDFVQIQANGSFTVKITDVLGNKIREQGGQDHTSMNISDLSSGHYFIHVGDKVVLLYKR
jgi:hypothetical protein